MSEICSPTGRPEPKGDYRERERDGASVGDEGRDRRREKDGEKQVDISVLPAHWDPFYANERANERTSDRPNEWTGGGEGSVEWGAGRGERTNVANGELAEPV